MIDPAHSSVEFAVKHMVVSTVKGRFTGFEGTIRFDEDDLELAAVQGSVDVSTIHTGNEGRDAHLRSDDFFSVDRFPRISFRSTKVERKGDEFKAYGELTIRDVTRPVVFDVEYDGQIRDAYGQQRAAFNAQTTINRADFGLTWNAVLEAGGVAVSEKVKLTLNIAAVEQREQA
jgi:polyisoprenoid-binding protein YceI